MKNQPFSHKNGTSISAHKEQRRNRLTFNALQKTVKQAVKDRKTCCKKRLFTMQFTANGNTTEPKQPANGQASDKPTGKIALSLVSLPLACPMLQMP